MSPIIYVSDASSELKAIRPLIIEGIRKLGMQVSWIDEADKERPDVVDIARQKMQQAAAFIGVVAFRRGWQPPDATGRSLTEIETDLALSRQIPTVVFAPVGDAESMLRTRAVNQNPAAESAQERFHQKLEQLSIVQHFENITDLARRILETLNSWAAHLNGQGAGGGVNAVAFTAPTSTLLGDSSLTVEELAERVAEKTADRIQQIQDRQMEELAEQAVRYNDALRLKPGELVFGIPASRSQFQSDIFMIMPFRNDLTRLYDEVIKPLIGEIGLTVARGDEFNSTQGVVMEDVWSALNYCQFVIAEITGGNDNVFYELGIAHTLNKPAILITQAQRPEDVPFDIRHLRYIVYRNNNDGLIRLREDLRTAITRLQRDLREGWQPTTGTLS
jgi:hypothetical protein